MKPFSELSDEEKIRIINEQYIIQQRAANKFNAYITLLDKELILDSMDRNAGKLKGLLLPVKDNISTKGIRTTCGSRILHNYTPPYNAHVIDRLMSEGAAVVGKTNMDEFAMGSTGETSYYGPTLNPWDTSRVPGGSSSGSAVAVAYGGYVSLGSDTGGSIRLPACYCGILGLKPTYGLVSRFGLIPYAESLEQIGPFARFSKDLALITSILIEYDERDMSMASSPVVREKIIGDLRKIVSEGVDEEKIIKETRIGYSEKLIGLAENDVIDAVEDVIGFFRDEIGIECVNVDIPLVEKALSAYYIIAMVEASSNLARYDATFYLERETSGSYWTATQEIRLEGFGDEVKRRIIMGTFASSAGYMGRYYLKALKVRRFIKDRIQEVVDRFDFFLMPVSPSLPPKLGEARGVDAYALDIYTVIPNLTGHPAIAIPAGFKKGLPVGIQLISNYYNDAELIKMAGIMEGRVYDPRKKPG